MSECLMPHYPLTNFEIWKHQNKPEFNGIYLRNTLSKIKDGACVRNLAEYESIETHWIGLHVNAENVTSFDSFGVERRKRNQKIHRKWKYCNKYL